MKWIGRTPRRAPTSASTGWSYFSNERHEILDLVPLSARRVLDVGCGSGATMRLIHRLLPSAEIIGVEVNLDVASASAQEILVGSIDNPDLRKKLCSCNQRFDCILLLDVLEHLVDPWETLRFVKSLLPRDGRLILSLPNVSNAKVLVPLLALDRFRYSDSGILDKTHLRFFTKTETMRLLQEAGFRLMVIRSSGPTSFQQVRSFKGLAAYLANLLTFRIFERFVAHQWIVLASPEA